MKLKEKLNDRFLIQRRNSSIKTEILAGITTFLTMAYVLSTQPSAIVGFGATELVDAAGYVITKPALLITCALVSGMICLFMGLYANLPVALSTAMGTNFVIGALVKNGTFSLGWAMALLLISGVIFIVITLCGIRELIVNMISSNLKISVTVVVGFFIIYLGMKNSGLAVFSDSGMKVGDFTNPAVILALITLVIIGVLKAFKLHSAILIGIVVSTVIGIFMGVVKTPGSIVAVPSGKELGQVLFKYDFKAVLSDIPAAISWIFILFMGDFFSTFGCLQAVGEQAGFLDEKGNFPDVQKPFLVDAIGTVVGSTSGCTTISSYIESTAGIGVGGRTGLTTIVTGLLFLIAIFFSPLFLMVPNAATGTALVYVGFSMLSAFKKIDLSDFKESFGPFVMIVFGIYTGSIAGAICIGVIFDTLMKLFTGRGKEVHWLIYLLCIPFALYFFV